MVCGIESAAERFLVGLSVFSWPKGGWMRTRVLMNCVMPLCARGMLAMTDQTKEAPRPLPIVLEALAMLYREDARLAFKIARLYEAMAKQGREET